MKHEATPKTEQTPNGLATYLQDDLRVYEIETSTTRTNRKGDLVRFRLVETFEEGRWEGFVAILN